MNWLRQRQLRWFFCRWLIAHCLTIEAFCGGQQALAKPKGAAPPPPAKEEKAQRARQLYERGKAAFEMGKFDLALEEYERAYEVLPLPGLLFNIGQCYRNLGNYTQAIFSFRTYLRKLPQAKNRAAVEKLIAELRLKADAARRRARELEKIPTFESPSPIEPKVEISPHPPVHTPPPVSETPFYKRWWFWVPLIAVAASGGVIGTYYLIQSREPSFPPSTLGVVPVCKNPADCN
jgi:tetratricopeptide (TPR) repeat protein